MLQQSLGYDLRQLDVETFEIEEINDVGIDAPGILIDDGGDGGGGGEFAATSSSCSCSSCCSCSTSSCCSCSTSTSSCG
jgi:hypothetical protein